MHARIAADASYLRVDPVSSREQYRWMERFIPMVEDVELRAKLAQSIDGKGAFRRFKDVLMTYAADRERWFGFRSERLRVFMESWLAAHALQAVPRPSWPEAETPESLPDGEAAPVAVAPSEVREARRNRNAEALRRALREVAEALGPRELDTLVAFGEFLRARRAARSFAHHAELHQDAAHDAGSAPGDDAPAAAGEGHA
jgi:hypothetical protein